MVMTETVLYRRTKLPKLKYEGHVGADMINEETIYTTVGPEVGTDTFLADRNANCVLKRSPVPSNIP